MVCEELSRGDREEYHVADFVVMPNHVHVLLCVAEGHCLETTLGCIKGRSARFCNLELQRFGAFWQADSYDHIVRTEKELNAYRQYIARNAVQAGLAASASRYRRADWL